MSRLPTDENQRIQSLDVLRGFALLGILLLNITYFADHSNAYLNAEGLVGLDLGVWAFVDVSAEGAMRCLFSILFGAGVVLFTQPEADRDKGTYFKRNLWLMVFGLVDGFLLLWVGDILFLYGLVALFLYAVRDVRPRRLLIASGVLIVLMSLQYGLSNFGLGMAQSAYEAYQADPEGASSEIREGAAAWQEFMQPEGQPSPSEEIALRTESYSSAFGWTRIAFTDMLIFVVPFILFWDALAMMLLGMALYKYDILQGGRPTQFYLKLGGLGLVVGLLANGSEAYRAYASGFDLLASFPQMQWSYHFGRLGMAMFWMSLLILCVKSRWLQKLTSLLAEVGRMALTNYLGQSLIALILFTGAGFALLGQFSRAQMYAVVIAIWIFQIFFSHFWLRHYRFGPLEWLWRGLTYGSFPSLRR